MPDKKAIVCGQLTAQTSNRHFDMLLQSDDRVPGLNVLLRQLQSEGLVRGTGGVLRIEVLWFDAETRDV